MKANPKFKPRPGSAQLCHLHLQASGCTASSQSTGQPRLAELPAPETGLTVLRRPPGGPTGGCGGSPVECSLLFEFHQFVKTWLSPPSPGLLFTPAIACCIPPHPIQKLWKAEVTAYGARCSTRNRHSCSSDTKQAQQETALGAMVKMRLGGPHPRSLSLCLSNT